MGPQHTAQRLASEPSCAPFVRNRQTPTADAMAASAELRPADRTGPDHDDAAIAAAVGSDAGRMRIARDDRLSEGMLVLVRRGKRGWLAGACQGQARSNSRKLARRKIGLGQRLHRRLEDRREALMQSKADVGGTGARL